MTSNETEHPAAARQGFGSDPAAPNRLTEAARDALRANAARGQAVRLYADWNVGPFGAELSRVLASHDIGFQVAVTDA